MLVFTGGVRDVVHGWISWTAEEAGIIDTPLFQRLRYVKQLTAAYFVYPDAVHTRFSHSLGVMHLMGKYAERLYPTGYQEQRVYRLAGLLHDVGHGPFSHEYDETVYSIIYPGVEKGHDEHRKFLVKQACSTIGAFRGFPLDEVMQLWSGANKIGKAVLSGPVGADRLDYLARDGHFCGTLFQVGHYERILNEVKILDGELAYPVNVIPEIVTLLQLRFRMYQSVYLHRISVAAQYALSLIMNNIIGPLHLVERTQRLDTFVHLTDEALLFEAKRVCPELVEAFHARRLPAMKVALDETPSTSDDIHPITREVCTLDLDKFGYIKAYYPDGTAVPMKTLIEREGTARVATVRVSLVPSAEG